MRVRAAAAAALLACLSGAPAGAADLFVNGTSGSDVRSGLTWADAKRSINPALLAASRTPEADTITVAAGTYYERIEIPPDVTLIGSVPAGGGIQDILVHPSIIDAERRRRAVLFGPGTDDSAIDGFIIRRGHDPDRDGGGGMFIDHAHPRVSRCIFEWNTSSLIGQALCAYIPLSGTEAPLIESCLFRNNGPVQIWIAETTFDDRVFPEPIMRDCIVEKASGAGEPEDRLYGGGVYVDIHGSLRFENIIVRDNNHSSAFGLRGTGGGALINCEISGRAGGLAITPGFPGRLEIRNCTIRSSEGPAIEACCGNYDPTTELDIRRSVVIGSGREFRPDPDGRPGIVAIGYFGPSSAYFTTASIQDNLILGWPAGFCCNTDGAATFASGALGDSYLSQVAAGQAVDSLGVDASVVLASGAGMDLLTTRTDAATDSGACDYGVHYWPRGLFGEVGDRLIVNRGTRASSLSFVEQVTGLPWSDVPGTLSDPTVPLLFYAIEMPENEIHVEKDLIADTVRIRF